VSAVFYPVSILPVWMQPVALALPSSYVFEGMRHMLQGQALSTTELLLPFVLNGVYMLLAALFFRRMYGIAREKGLLAKVAS
jgi:ABC-2 type transport system permease protein